MIHRTQIISGCLSLERARYVLDLGGYFLIDFFEKFMKFKIVK